MADWQKKAAAKREANVKKIPKEWLLPAEFLKGNETSNVSVLDVPAKCGILTPEEVIVTQNFDAVSLAKVVQVGALKAEGVAIAFCKRAAIAQQLTNCLTETFFDDAIKRGKWLDEYMAKHGKPVGPLHGIPISIKDPFNYTGVQATLGMISYLDRPAATENSPLIDILLELGAILYCKTNIPQTMMTADSDNNTFGRTLNPHRLSLGAGGSSGGEGALVAMRGSVIGVGTDIGGKFDRTRINDPALNILRKCSNPCSMQWDLRLQAHPEQNSVRRTSLRFSPWIARLPCLCWPSLKFVRGHGAFYTHRH